MKDSVKKTFFRNKKNRLNKNWDKDNMQDKFKDNKNKNRNINIIKF